MKSIYDRTLVFFPDGFTDQDKKSDYCIFDDQFFKTLTAWNEKQADKKALQKYELDILPEKDLGSPSSTRLEALVPSRDSRAMTRSPSPQIGRAHV